MSHPWWLVYVAGALLSFGLAFGGMTRALVKIWNTRCDCGEKTALHGRVASVGVILAVYVIRSGIWFVAVPVEFLWLARQGLKERERQ